MQFVKVLAEIRVEASRIFAAKLCSPPMSCFQLLWAHLQGGPGQYCNVNVNDKDDKDTDVNDEDDDSDEEDDDDDDDAVAGENG